MNAIHVNTIKEWLFAHSNEPSPCLTVSQDPFLPLVVELEGDIMYVGYWRVENGDLVPDPAVRVDISTMQGTVLTQICECEDDWYADSFLELVEKRLSRATQEEISTFAALQ